MLFNLKESLSNLVLKLQKLPATIQYNKLIKKGLLEVGRYTYGVPEIDVYINSERKVTIGSFCSISKNVRFITGGIHPADWVSTFPIRDFVGVDIPYDGMPTSNGEIVIGHDVWIGTGVTILSGVTIGTGSIIAAGAIVTRDIQPYSIVAGVPAKVIRMRFAPKQIEHLLAIKWWEWKEEEIKKCIHYLSSNKIEEFIEKYKID